MKVAIQGEAGSFSHEAAKRMVKGAPLYLVPTRWKCLIG